MVRMADDDSGILSHDAGKTMVKDAAPGDLVNINQASKLCGLSPSVLRIWELRYGWPQPQRKANG